MFWVTQALAVGPFPRTPDSRLGPDPFEMRAAGITHALNVGNAPSRLYQRAWPGRESDSPPFVEALDLPIEDLARIPDGAAIEAIDHLHRMASAPGAAVYVHCHAGQHRSPTVIWLYLIALGVRPVVASSLISDASMDAYPGHPKLIDDALVDLVGRHGQRQGWPRTHREELMRPPEPRP